MSSGQFSNAYELHKDAVNPNRFASGGIAPINQMTNGFGGRQGGNPNQSMGQTFGGIGAAGGNRTSQHVVTPGNNNVSYASPTLLASANTLWQKAMNAPGSPGPANGMSLGFIKNTEQRRPAAAAPAPAAPTAPVPPPPTTGLTGTAAVAAGATLGATGQVIDAGARMEEQKRVEAAAQQPVAQSGVGTVAPGTAAPKPSGMTLAQAQAAYTGPKTMKGPNGSTIRTVGWTNYLKQNGLL